MEIASFEMLTPIKTQNAPLFPHSKTPNPQNAPWDLDGLICLAYIHSHMNQCTRAPLL